MRFLFGTLPFMAVVDDDLEHLAQAQEERHTTTIDFEFHRRDLKDSAITFQAVVRQSFTTNLIDGPARPPIRTLSTTTRSSGLALSEIRIMNPEESA
jgi:hypothetical protein